MTTDVNLPVDGTLEVKAGRRVVIAVVVDDVVLHCELSVTLRLLRNGTRLTQGICGPAVHRQITVARRRECTAVVDHAVQTISTPE